MFLDIAIGILLAFFVSEIYEVTASLTFVVVSIVFVLFPDIDLLLTKVIPDNSKVSKLIGGHRGLFHYPSIYLLTGFLVTLSFGKVWGTLFLLTTLFHLIHDTFFLGWGIKWWWPISTRSYKLFPDRNGKILNQFLLAWDKSEESEVKSRYGTSHWIRDFYLRPSLISIMEYSAFVAALFQLYIHFK